MWVTFMCVVVLSMQSCFLFQKEEGCTDPEAENYDPSAEKSDGTCTYKRDRYLGTFKVNENCNSGNFTYNVTISAAVAGGEAVVINNLGNYGFNVNANIASGAKLIFSETQSTITFSGEGDINGNTLSIVYSTSSGGIIVDNCTLIGIKQF